jgi:endonuclease/exonuclease/phosphatase family metal-dependent hydrolase
MWFAINRQGPKKAIYPEWEGSMPYYKPVFDNLKAVGQRTAARKLGQRLLKLRRQLKKEIPQRNVTDSVLVATWNLREFGRNQKYGKRSDSSLLCIAEIISHFDLIAIQEVHQNLQDLKRLLHLVGHWWDYIVTDVTPGRAGNEERMAFLYDTRKIRFDHLAGEVVLAEAKKPIQQLSRSPFICAFRTGWRRLSLCSVHMYYGKADPNDPRRVAEIDALAKLLAERNEKRQNTADGEPESLLLLGDFNIFNQKGDKTSRALQRHNFEIPQAILKIKGGGNMARDRYYDQIAFHDPKKLLRSTPKAGVFEFTKSIFGKNEARDYMQEVQMTAKAKLATAKDKAKFYNVWRTFQMSDHYPLWIELKINFADGYLATCAGYVRRKDK